MRRARAQPGRRRAGGPRARGAAARHPKVPAAAPERLQKVLARAGLASRREAESWIRAGRLTINGVMAGLGVRVAPHDEVRLDGRRVRVPPVAGAPRAFLCHRSPGEALGTPATSVTPEPSEPPRAALLERLPRRSGRRYIAVSPMPRADGGLELVTADGELALRLQRAVRALASEFSVRVHGELTASRLEGIRGGLLDSGARLEIAACCAPGSARRRSSARSRAGSFASSLRRSWRRSRPEHRRPGRWCRGSPGRGARCRARSGPRAVAGSRDLPPGRLGGASGCARVPD